MSRRWASPAERFAAGWVMADDGCHVWTGRPSNGGYGQIRVNGRKVVVHKFAYELIHSPVPAGMDLDHLCRNRMCVNIAHLEVVTHRENVVRGIGPTAVNASKTHCIHGHPFDEANTAPRDDGGRRCITCRRIAGARRRGTVKVECPTCQLALLPVNLVRHMRFIHAAEEVA